MVPGSSGSIYIVSIPYRKVRYLLESSNRRSQRFQSLIGRFGTGTSGPMVMQHPEFQSLIGRFGTGSNRRNARSYRFQSLIGRFGTLDSQFVNEVVGVSIPYRKVRYTIRVNGTDLAEEFQSLIGRFGTCLSVFGLILPEVSIPYRKVRYAELKSSIYMFESFNPL